jgi:hypothetical protein
LLSYTFVVCPYARATISFNMPIFAYTSGTTSSYVFTMNWSLGSVICKLYKNGTYVSDIALSSTGATPDTSKSYTYNGTGSNTFEVAQFFANVTGSFDTDYTSTSENTYTILFNKNGTFADAKIEINNTTVASHNTRITLANADNTGFAIPSFNEKQVTYGYPTGYAITNTVCCNSLISGPFAGYIMCDKIQSNPLYDSGWTAVATSTEYTFTHNLQLFLTTPARYTLYFCTTAAVSLATATVVDITGLLQRNGSNYGYAMLHKDGNTILIKTSATAVYCTGSTVFSVGYTTANTNYTTGYYRLYLY